MKIKLIKRIAYKVSSKILNAAESGQLECRELVYDQKGTPIGDYQDVYTHSGIYAFTIEKQNRIAVAYVGKSEGDKRLREHITGVNKSGTPHSPSLKTKHQKIKNAIQSGYTVKVHLYSNPDFDKSSLSCIELSALVLAKLKFTNIFPEEEQWIQRIG